MASNKRIFYACEGVQLAPVSDVGLTGTWVSPKGLQSVGMTTNFNLEKVFQLGQLAVYENIEGNPEIEVTLNKILDGTKPLFHICMAGKDNPDSDTLNIATGQNNKVAMKFLIYPESNLVATGAPTAELLCKDMYANSFTYTFPTDGNATEEVTLVGNDKTWSGGTNPTNVIGTSNDGQGEIASTVVRRWKFDTASCIFPTGSGAMRLGQAGEVPPLTNVSVSFDLGREPIYTLGSYKPYLRTVTFPVEITTEIESLAIDGDYLDINENTYSCLEDRSKRPANKEIRFVICGSGNLGGNTNKLAIDLGKRNKLSSISYGGGEAGGGNLTVTYSFTTDNFFTMTTSGTWKSTSGITYSEGM